MSYFEGYDEYDRVVNEFNVACAMPFSTKPHTRTYSDYHIFDEEKSVKWNREEVKRQNLLIKEDRDKCRSERFDAINAAKEHIIDYLCTRHSKFSRNKVAAIFKYIYDNEYSEDYKIDYVIDTCEEILEIFSKEELE